MQGAYGRVAPSLGQTATPYAHREAADASGVHVQVTAPSPPTPSAPVVTALAQPRSTGARKYDPHTPLFRREALAAYARGERAAAVLRITSVSRWALLFALTLSVALAAGLTALGSVEETSAARGVLRAAFGVQSVVAPVAGSLREVRVRAGDHVRAGALIARIDAAPLEAELQAAEQTLMSVEQQWLESRRVLSATHARSATLIAARTGLLEASRKRQQQRVSRRGLRAARIQDPSLESVVEEAAREDSMEAVTTAEDSLHQVLQELASLKLQAASTYNEYRQGLAAGEQRVREARTRRDAVRVLLQQTELTAPIEGKVESLRGHPGQVVQAGEWIAKVVRDDVPSTLLAFVPERDVAFLRVGARASVEVDQLPVGEFGHVDARVVRVAGELADRSELVSAFGEAAPNAPHVRVELEVLPNATTARARSYLRPGTLVTARIALRERRLLTIAFEPARRWLD